MSAFAALAVASPAAVVALPDLSERPDPPAPHRQFVQAAMITDLPNELMSALSQGLSQFGINLPPLPTGLAPGLTTPPAGLDPALAAPISNAAGLPAPGEVPIAAPIGLDPAAGTYPILGDPSLAAAPATSGGGRIIRDLSRLGSQLGAGQAIDLR